MEFLSENKQVLMRRLKMKGMEQNAILGFVWSLKSCLFDNPEMNHLQTKERMQFLGWDDFVLDYYTFQLAIKCFEAEGYKRAETYNSSDH